MRCKQFGALCEFGILRRLRTVRQVRVLMRCTWVHWTTMLGPALHSKDGLGGAFLDALQAIWHSSQVPDPSSPFRCSPSEGPHALCLGALDNHAGPSLCSKDGLGGAFLDALQAIWHSSQVPDPSSPFRCSPSEGPHALCLGALDKSVWLAC